MNGLEVGGFIMQWGGEAVLTVLDELECGCVVVADGDEAAAEGFGDDVAEGFGGAGE